MKIAIFGKYPPIQGGVSRQVYQTAHALAASGHRVQVITNADQAEPHDRMMLYGDDLSLLEKSYPGGGSVTVHNIAGLLSHTYIPWAQPFASQLFGLGLRVLTDNPPDVIVGWYFEPYGLVAAQLAQTLKKPLILAHAGSDLARLSQQPELRSAYEWMIGRSGKILTASVAVPKLRDLGATVGMFQPVYDSKIPRPFSAPTPPLDTSKITILSHSWFKAMRLDDKAHSVLSQGLANLNEVTPNTPIIATYGKVGISKGSFELLQALDQLSGLGYKFLFLSLAGGKPQSFQNYLSALAKMPNLSSQSAILPFLAPWRIPSFLALCDICCFLEHDFGVDIHVPHVPQEVLTSGTALVCSGSIAGELPYRLALVDGVNYAGVEPVRPDSICHAISQLLDDPSRTARMAAAGRQAVARINFNTLPDGPADAIITAARVLLG